MQQFLSLSSGLILATVVAGCATNPLHCTSACKAIAPQHQTLSARQKLNIYDYEALPDILYVATNGQPGNSGTEQAPLNSLASALARARAIHRDAPGTPLTIELLPGTHYLEESLVIGALDSGSPQTPLVIRGSAKGRSQLSGGRRLKNLWQQMADGTWWTTVEGPSFDQLFIEGNKQIRARYPNYNPEVAVFNGHTTAADIKRRAKTWSNPEGGYLHALHGARWGGFHYQITGKNDDGSLKLSGGWQNNRPANGMHKNYQFVDNIREELDQAGEWYYEENRARLYIKPPEGVALNQAKVEVAGLKELIIVRGNSSKPVKHISIENLTLVHAGESFMQTAEPLLRSDWTLYRGGAIFIENAEDVQLDNNRLIDLGGNGVVVSGYARNIRITTNHFSQLGASAISFVGKASSVRSPAFQYHQSVQLSDMDREPGPKSPEYPSHSLVEDNLIHDIGRLEKQSAGIQLSMAAEITLRHNSIYNVPRSGINISEGTWGGHVLEFNDVFNTVLETEDHGAFNSWGRDRFWHPNRWIMNRTVAKDPSLPSLDAIKTTVIRNNRFQTSHGWDIDLDDGSSNYHIYNNLCLEGGLKLREGFHRTVENNILLNNGFHPHVWFKNSGDIFRKNLVMSAHADIRISDWGAEVDKNLYLSRHDLQTDQAKGVDSNSLFGELGFANYQTGNYSVVNLDSVAAIGFKNFPMTQFGVKNVKLKAIAQQPEFPKPEIFRNNRLSQSNTWLGLEIKNIETLGERSAAGLKEASGVLILSAPVVSSAHQAGLLDGDVIISVVANGSRIPVYTVKDLLSVERSTIASLTVVRNQKNTLVHLESE
ncbi:PDZ domain-containing protein [uncultured Microbulbifer sp.]|uniref:PDZ domain-containing protein n=1 Tax=uncultured Microbulbifer sp. TaxID=348147 RepID=UPI002612BDF2|nr:PDZ domain-containing protein [uncultured Microbulbifer sp.]